MMKKYTQTREEKAKIKENEINEAIEKEVYSNSERIEKETYKEDGGIRYLKNTHAKIIEVLKIKTISDSKYFDFKTYSEMVGVKVKLWRERKTKRKLLKEKNELVMVESHIAHETETALNDAIADEDDKSNSRDMLNEIEIMIDKEEGDSDHVSDKKEETNNMTDEMLVIDEDEDEEYLSMEDIIDISKEEVEREAIDDMKTNTTLLYDILAKWNETCIQDGEDDISSDEVRKKIFESIVDEVIHEKSLKLRNEVSQNIANLSEEMKGNDYFYYSHEIRDKVIFPLMRRNLNSLFQSSEMEDAKVKVGNSLSDAVKNMNKELKKLKHSATPFELVFGKKTKDKLEDRLVTIFEDRINKKIDTLDIKDMLPTKEESTSLLAMEKNIESILAYMEEEKSQRNALSEPLNSDNDTSLAHPSLHSDSITIEALSSVRSLDMIRDYSNRQEKEIEKLKKELEIEKTYHMNHKNLKVLGNIKKQEREKNEKERGEIMILFLFLLLFIGATTVTLYVGLTTLDVKVKEEVKEERSSKKYDTLRVSSENRKLSNSKNDYYSNPK